MGAVIVLDDSFFREYLPVFATREYLNFQSKEFGWFVSEDFVMPWFITTKFGFRSLRITSSPVQIGPGGLPDSERHFLEAACSLAARELIVDRIVQPQNNAVFRVVPKGSVHAPFGSLFVPLKNRNTEDLFSALHSKHRNVIRRAERDGVDIDVNTNKVGECIDLFRSTMARYHMGVPKISYFDSLFESLGNQILLAAATKNGIIQGCALIPWNRYGAYYFWGGSTEFPYGGSLNLLHWRIIDTLKDLDVEKYDFVGARCSPEPGSKPESIQRFKARFGATFAPGFLWKFNCRPWRSRALTAALSVRAMLSGRFSMPDLIDQERVRLGDRV
ncbi:MAG: GNAT family N-acetyltransferase [Castellaniella sp.]|uniref:GNAT family N-acetyltransferase n=1 Tax=Castellaniella sp. TaxID=1955812 RepID=UPI003C7776B9